MEKSKKPSMLAVLRRIQDELRKEWEGLTWDERLRLLHGHAAADSARRRRLRETRAGEGDSPPDRAKR